LDLANKNKRVFSRDGVLPDESAKQDAPINNNQNIKMKTKITRLAATLFAVVTLAPAAFAGPGVGYWQNHGRAGYRQNPGQQPTSSTHTKFVLNDRCKADSCCAKKTVASNGGGRATQGTFKTVVTCEKNCATPTASQGTVCRKGLRA
jgi:hypothetical protein